MSWRCKRQIVAVVVQLLVVTPRTAALQASLSFLISQSVFTLMSVESCCHPTISASVTLFSSCPQAFPASGSLHQVPDNWSFSFSISPSNEYSGLISFRMDWLDLLAVQRTLKSLPRHHSSKASIIQCSAFFIVQLSHGKTIALTRQTFVGRVMSLLFNMWSRLVIAFLPRSKHLLISWLQSLSAVILEPPKIKSVIVSIVSPSICHEVMGLDAMILVF